MLHLDPERLAALADEAPTAEEGAHLALCLACRRERDAYVALVALAQREGHAAVASDATGAGAPLTAWSEIAAALRTDGMLADVAVPQPSASDDARVLRLPVRGADPRRLALDGARLRRVAAAALFVAGGAAAGRASVGAPALPWTDAALVASAPGLGSTPLTDSMDGGAGTALLTAGAQRFSSVDEASQVLSQAQRDYQRAAAFLAEHDSTAVVGSSDVLRARLAALDDVMPRVREALNEVPQDPVLNQVYLTTYDVRESTLRQLGRTLPVGARVNGY